jgi:hypothetical protein
VVGPITIGTGSSGPFTFAAPKTTLTIAPPTPNGKAGWFVTAVIITLTAFDYSSTGIKNILYSRDSSQWILYGGPFTYGGATDYADEGTTTLYYRATDNAGDQESTESQVFMIDTRAPVITAPLNPTSARVAPLVINFSAADPTPGSGLDSSSVNGLFSDGTFNIQPVINGQTIDLFWQPLGTYGLAVTASDIAGNSANRTVSTQLIASLASLKATIIRLRQLSEIDNDGVENSFLADVDAATNAFNRGHSNVAVQTLGALLDELSAQRGNHITARAADLLSADVMYVQAHLS